MHVVGKAVSAKQVGGTVAGVEDADRLGDRLAGHDTQVRLALHFLQATDPGPVHRPAPDAHQRLPGIGPQRGHVVDKAGRVDDCEGVVDLARRGWTGGGGAVH